MIMFFFIAPLFDLKKEIYRCIDGAFGIIEINVLLFTFFIKYHVQTVKLHIGYVFCSSTGYIYFICSLNVISISI